MNALSCASCGGLVVDDGVLNGLCTACLLSSALQDPAAPDQGELTPGATLGPYEIVSMLGSGGMGRVYLAWDGRLCRTVAVKVLAAAVTADDERKRRLEREARIVAGLDHPQIGAVYDIGCEQGMTYVVMEHLDGETLATRLRRGPLPIADVLRYGMEMADGLDCAHRHGVTHRDLKPANIMLTRSGVTLLDFGLAARSHHRCVAGAEADGQMSTLGGTIQYMAPEQLESTIADVRSDVFAFGLVLYEMLTGRAAFAAGTREELMAAVAAAQVPPVSAMRLDVPITLERVVQRCVKRDPEERWQSLRDVGFELRTTLDDLTNPRPSSERAKPQRRWAVAIGVMVLLISMAAAPYVPVLANRAAPASAIRFAATSPRPVSEFTGLGDTAYISPDGRSFAWVSVTGPNGKTMLYVQRLDSPDAKVLDGTDDAWSPFWSPDSKTIAFFTRDELRTVPAVGGSPETIAKAANAGGGTWSRRGTILFASSKTGPIYEVSARGGELRQVTTLDATGGEQGHLWPQYLPDGSSFVYFAANRDPERRGVFHQPRTTAAAQFIVKADGGAVWAPPDHLLFTRGGMLLTQRFDTAAVRMVGEPQMLQPRVCGADAILWPCFSASHNGVLVYHIARLFRHRFAWFSRSGQRSDVAIEPGSYFNPVLSPEGQRLAIERHDPQTWQLGIWQFNLEKRMLSRVTDMPLQTIAAVWSPDGQAIAFSGFGESDYGIFVARTDAGPPRRLLSWPRNTLALDWSSDQQRLLFSTRGDTTGSDLWVLPVDQPQSAFPYLQSRFNERQARFSPNGRWVAYQSDEAGRPEVYIQPFPATGAKWQVSTDGGQQPAWRSDGRELFYLSADRRLMAAPIRLGASVHVDKAVELFRVPPDAPRDNRLSYAPSADGQRFLVNVAAADRPRLPLYQAEVLVNWRATLHD